MYEVLKPLYGTRLNLLYTDTDSFVFSLKSRDIDADLAKIEDTLCKNSTLFRFKVKISAC